MTSQSMCEIHEEFLLSENVPIRYGLIRFSPEFIDAKPRLFPNSRSFVLGGCMVGPNQPKNKVMLYCPKCREADQVWTNDHAMYAGGRR